VPPIGFPHSFTRLVKVGRLKDQMSFHWQRSHGRFS
jgi:hypothetical protein